MFPICGDITQRTFVEPKRSGMRGVTVLEGLVTVWSRWDSYSGVVRQMPSRSKDAQAREPSQLCLARDGLVSQELLFFDCLLGQRCSGT